MKYRSYHKEVQKVTAQFLDLFDGIVIDRRTPGNSVQKTFTVPCLYESRSRVLKSLENRGNTVPLPIICSSITGISKDASRVIGSQDELMLDNTPAGRLNYLKKTAIPINIKYELSIIAKFQEDIDQIESNFMPFFNPDIYIVVPQPNAELNMKCQVLWDGAFTLTYPNEIDKNTPSRLVSTTSFTVKAWMFAGMDNEEITGYVIKRINFNPCIQWEDGIGRLSNWYAVPNTMSFDDYRQNIICGYIKTGFYDELQISAGLSAYWEDISAVCTGLVLDEDLTNALSANPPYLVTSDGGLLLISKNGYVSRGMAAISLHGYNDYVLSTLTGDLSGYRQCPDD